MNCCRDILADFQKPSYNRIRKTRINFKFKERLVKFHEGDSLSHKTADQAGCPDPCDCPCRNQCNCHDASPCRELYHGTAHVFHPRLWNLHGFQTRLGADVPPFPDGVGLHFNPFRIRHGAVPAGRGTGGADDICIRRLTSDEKIHSDMIIISKKTSTLKR